MEVLFSTPHQSVAPDQFFVASEDQFLMSRYTVRMEDALGQIDTDNGDIAHVSTSSPQPIPELQI